MKAIRFNFTVPRYLLGLGLGKLYLPAMWSGLACLQYTDVPEPGLPNQEWVKIKTRYGGICGTDNHIIHLETSPSLSAFGSYPFTIGHENCGTIAEVGSAVPGFSVGERVVVEPTLSCVPRGLPPCEFCARGQTQLCLRMTEGAIAPGLVLGGCRDTGGSWSPYFLAHHSQLVRVPDGVSDENAVMLEPFATSLHAVLANAPSDDQTVVVIGAGVIGLGIVAALRAIGSRARIIVLARHKIQQELAKQYGAEIIIPASGDYDSELARAVGAKLLKPIVGKPVLVGGADFIYECVGNSGSVADSIRFAAPRGRVVVTGLAAIPKDVDWTPIWAKELRVQGVNTYSLDEFEGKQCRTFELGLQLMEQGRVDVGKLVTHRFRLADYGKAFETVNHRARERAVKVVFEF